MRSNFKPGDYALCIVEHASETSNYSRNVIYKICSTTERRVRTLKDNGNKPNGWRSNNFINLGPELSAVERELFKVIE